MIATQSQIKTAHLRVGTAVTIKWGAQNVHGVITEDRGAIGIGGRQLYRVDVDLGNGSLVVMELPVSEIKKSETDRNDPTAVGTAEMADAIIAKMQAG